MTPPLAVWCSRWRFDTTDLGDLSDIGDDGPAHTGRVGRWYYTVGVQGSRGALFRVDLVQRDHGKPPYPFAVKRRGRCVGRGSRREAIERAAVEALS